MLVKKTSSTRPKTNAINLPVEVTGYDDHTYNDKTTRVITGVNQLNGNPVILKLSDSLAGVESSNRLRVGQLEHGYEDQFEHKHVVGKGDLFIANGAYKQAMTPEGAEVWFYNWPVMLTTNHGANKGSVTSGQHVMLRVFDRKETDQHEAKRSGYADVLDVGKTSSVVRDNLADKLADLAKDYKNPVFMIRAMNNQNQVVGVLPPISRINVQNEEGDWVRRSNADIGAEVSKVALENFEQTTFVVTPAERFQIGQLALNDEKNFETLKRTANFFVADSPAFNAKDYVVKDAYLKTGNGEYRQILNKVHVVDPFGPGVDPALLNNKGERALTYAPEYLASFAEADSAAQSAKHESDMDMDADDTFAYTPKPG